MAPRRPSAGGGLAPRAARFSPEDRAESAHPRRPCGMHAMDRPSRLPALAAVLCSLALCAHVPSQDPGHAEPREPARGSVKAQRPDVPPEARTFDLEFAGGTLENLIAAIRKALGSAPNIVLSEGVRAFRVPSFELHACQLEPALQAISQVIEPKIVVNSVAPGTFAIYEDPSQTRKDTVQQVRVLKLRDLIRTDGEPLPPKVWEAHVANVLAAVAAGLEFSLDTELLK